MNFESHSPNITTIQPWKTNLLQISIPKNKYLSIDDIFLVNNEIPLSLIPSSPLLKKNQDSLSFDSINQYINLNFKNEENIASFEHLYCGKKRLFDENLYSVTHYPHVSDQMDNYKKTKKNSTNDIKCEDKIKVEFSNFETQNSFSTINCFKRPYNSIEKMNTDQSYFKTSMQVENDKSYLSSNLRAFN